MNHVEHLYLHIPFCTHICAYCDFVKSRYHEGLADQVIHRLVEDIETCPSLFLKTCYIGGGTPSALSLHQLELLLKAIQIKWGNIEEFSVEINPEDMTLEKMECLKKYGVNRLSMGVQAIQQRLLTIITRHHDFNDVRKVTHWAHECGINNISYDLMYGLPTQTIEEFKASMIEVVRLNPTHLSLYALTIEPNTAFGRQKVQPVDNELEGLMYQCAIDTLTQLGYHHYEVSSFAKTNDFRSQHNLSYWRYKDFIGLGPGAASKVGNQRWTNTRNIHHYTLKENLLSEEVFLTHQDSVIEHLMMGLRLDEPLDLSKLAQDFPELIAQLNTVLYQSAECGWCHYDYPKLESTPLGRLFLHDFIVKIMEALEN